MVNISRNLNINTMKDKTSINSLLVVALMMLSLNCNRQVLSTGYVNFVSGKEGTITLRASGLGTNEGAAISDAEKNAFDALLFRGIPGSEQKVALAGTNEAELKENHRDYFVKFYNERRYKTFVTSSIPVTDLLKAGSGYKSLAADITINLVALRKDLEQFNIIRKFGF